MLESFQSGNLERKESSEEWFYRKAGELPAELAKKWIDEYENEEDPEGSDFFTRFKDFLKNRELALIKSFEIEEGIDEETVAEIINFQEVVQNTFGDINYFINNGSTAEVYYLPVAPNLCVKYINNQETYNEHNHLRTEFNFLRDLSSLSVKNVRTPIPYFINIHPSLGHSYGMERVFGKSLSQILEKPNENLALIKILKTINREDVKSNLIEYIREMHKNFGITHNDLEHRNIMLDEAGHFYIIDFGKAKQEDIGEDHEVFRNSDITKISKNIEDFFNKIDNIDINDIMEEVN